jgi:hypothetical protein
MKQGSLLPHSQEPSIYPCPESEQSMLHFATPLFKIHFNIILSSTHRNPVDFLVKYTFPKNYTFFFLIAMTVVLIAYNLGTLPTSD